MVMEAVESLDRAPHLLLLGLEETPPEDWVGWRGLGHRKRMGQVTLVILYGLEPSLHLSARFLLAGADKVIFASPGELAGLSAAWLARQAADEEAMASATARMRKLGIVSRSGAMRQLFERLERAANFSALPVLITGESGTGKELFARAVHSLDPSRNGRRFVAINCAALNANLLESELFGHARGAYTGAERERSGLFRSADGGVIFLDEIGELEAGMQAKLLRVLQFGAILPLGQDREITIDVRVVAATNRDLEAMVAGGTFREDLYHRLNAIQMRIPPLRERPEDIDALVEHLLGSRNQEGSGSEGISPALREGLTRARFSGNVRQLENLLRSAMVQHRGPGPLELEDCPQEFWRELEEQRPPRIAPRAEGADLNLERGLALREEELVRAAMEQSRGNQARAAELLGVTPRSVYNKLRKMKRA